MATWGFCTLLPQFRGLQRACPIVFFLVSMQTDKAQYMIDGVNGDSDLHRHQGVHRHWIVIVFHCCCCFDAGAASGQLFMHGLVTLPQHLFQNKSLTLSVTFNIIVKRLFEFWASATDAFVWALTVCHNSSFKTNISQPTQHFFPIVVNFKLFAFAVFTLIWPLCHRSSFKTHLSHSLDISMCYRHCKYKNHRRKLMFSLSLSEGIDYI